MRISPELPATNLADAGGTASVRTPKSDVSQNGPSEIATGSPASAELQKPVTEQASVTEALNLSFRKDPDGRTFYVLSDPQSGQTVREIPPQEIRQLGRSIDDYLKSQATLARRRTDTKA